MHQKLFKNRPRAIGLKEPSEANTLEIFLVELNCHKKVFLFCLQTVDPELARNANSVTKHVGCT